MYKPAFTLIETLIAAVIVVIILGASVTANRIISASATQSEDRAQLSSLADEGLEQVRALRDFSSTDLGSAVHLLPDTKNDSQYGAFISNVASPCAGAACPTVENGGPVKLIWCDQDASNAACRALPTPFKINGCATSPCKVGDLFNKYHGDVVALRRSAYTTTGPDNNKNRLVVDMSNPVNNPQPRSLDLSSDTTDWNFYKRQIQIIRFGFSSGNSANLGFLQANNQRDIRQATYQVTVILTNLNNATVSISKSMVLTDWK